MVGMIVFYAVLIGICLFMLYQIYNAIMELLREMLADAFEDGRKYARESSDSKKKGSRRVWCVWFNDEKAGFLLGTCRFAALISSS